MPLQATSGAASYDAFGGGVPVEPVYIEQIFQTWLYTGNGSNRTIDNGIDLAGKGGLTWIKSRNNISTVDHLLFDTARGNDFKLSSNLTAGSQNQGAGCWSPTSSGFAVNNGFQPNYNTDQYASWTFREQPKFFDVVTWTGNNTARTIAHNLGSVPGCIIVKNTENASSWTVYHRSLGNTKHLNLNETASEFTSTSWNNTTPTSTEFTLGSLNNVNASGDDFVAYLFAHDAGGFGLTGTDNVISCGSFNGADANVSVTLGYEPQWLLVKRTDGAGTWRMFDNMRGMTADGKTAMLYANASDAEIATNTNVYTPTATGFIAGSNIVTGTYIYIAIRRGPMKVPTTGTSVFDPKAANSPTDTQITTGFPVDLQIQAWRGGAHNTRVIDRLRGVNTTSAEISSPFVNTDEQIAESTAVPSLTRSWGNTGFVVPTGNSSIPMIWWNFRRAPGFFDEVCFTQASGTQNHNLGVAPELVILKSRSTADSWYVFAAQNGFGELNRTVAWAGLGNGSGLGVNLANVTSTTLSRFGVFGTGNTAVAYLFASCPGVSRVGTYTGNGTTQTINCGFTGGARFVMIKRTDASGDWYVWDSARGIVAGNDPYLLLNSTAAEMTLTDFVDPVSTGFELSSTALATVNVSGGTYIFLAIA